jgi:hypothetical protein
MYAAGNRLGSEVELVFEDYRTQLKIIHKSKKRNGREFGV